MLILSQAPADLKAVVEFLRAKNGPKIRRGVLNGKRVDYFKGQPGPPFPFHLYQNITCPDADGGDSGKTAIRTLLGPAYQKLKNVPPITTEEEASGLLTKILPLYVHLFPLPPSPFSPLPLELTLPPYPLPS